MSDLAPILRLRLKSIDGEVADLDRRREQLLRHKQTIEAALLQEQALAATRSAAEMTGTISPDDPDAGVEEEAPQERANLSQLLIGALATGPKALGELKIMLDPYFEAGANGRAINFALVGLQKGGHVERLPHGAWKLSRVGGK